MINDRVWWSPELFRIFDLPVAEEAPPYEVHHTLFTEDSWLRLQPAVAAAAEKGTAYELDLELAPNKGKQRYAVARCEPETLLRLSETITAGGIGLWDWDLTTNEVHFSKEYKRQLGYGIDEFGDSFDEWERRVHPDDLKVTLDSVNNSIENLAQQHEAVFRMMHRDGEYRWILAHASTFGDKNGKPVRVLGSHIDITERKKLELQLRQSHKMEALGQLAGGIAHDFNNQLSSILGFAELIKGSDDLNAIKRYADKIISTAEHTEEMTKKLLLFARKDNLVLRPLDIHRQIFECVALLRHSIDKNISIETHLDACSPVIAGERNVIQNIVLNLGLNARDAMPTGDGLRSVPALLKLIRFPHWKMRKSETTNIFKSP